MRYQPTTKLKARLLTALVVVLGFGVAYNVLAALDVMVSLKYETDGPQECFSLITGHNLCLRLKIHEIAAPVCFFLALGLAIAKDVWLEKVNK
ncbi:hypothetical protein E5K00_03405 [Hymenobacter aquaticus]|uniref:Uncharacterized protein n=1 Tax=Hymenobacter aquaticus TaxID=1867101 RepID=A0A4Z0Q3W3_9BACT|nr:hypothetical protein [Hymenobacter aquaticus]TGE24274.1 hypothetical protein E5K00_03405 [Hymenobacter aquaticus]